MRKRHRRPDGISQIALSLIAPGLTTGELAAHLEEVYGVRVSKVAIYRVIGKVMGEMAEWRRPLDRRVTRCCRQSRSWPSRKEL